MIFYRALCAEHCVQTSYKDKMLFYDRFACHASLIIHTRALFEDSMLSSFKVEMLFYGRFACHDSLIRPVTCHDEMMLFLLV